MAICQSCYEFVDDSAPTCPGCARPMSGTGFALGLEFAPAVMKRPRAFRPTLLLWPIAAIPVVFGLWRFALGDQVMQRATAAVWAYQAILGGISVGGLVVMLQRKQRGYSLAEASVWRVAGFGAVLVPGLTGLLRVSGGFETVALSALTIIHWALMLAAGTAVLMQWTRARSRTIPVLAWFVSLAWVVSPPFLIQILFWR